MIIFICLFLPAIIPVVKKYETINKDNFLGVIGCYSTNCLLINFITLLVVSFMNNFNYTILDISTFSIVFVIKYLFMSVLLANVLPAIKNHLQDNVKLKIELSKKEYSKNNGKKRKNKNEKKTNS